MIKKQWNLLIMGSKYCYQDTNVLINKFDIKEQKKLNTAEKLFTNKRILELTENPLYEELDFKHLQNIHKYIFQDIYPFAGQIREVDITKANTLFCISQFIPNEANRMFNELKQENNLIGYDVSKFAERSSYYFAEINMLHPFREGNGRSQREFIRTLGINAGFKIDWAKTDIDTFFKAQVKSQHDLKDLEKTIYDCIENKEKNYNMIDNYKTNGRKLDY